MKKYDLKNVVLYCKGWYEHPKSNKDHWKYLSVAIANDGWVIRETKHEVVRWIVARYDENPEWFRQARNDFGIAWFMDEMQKQKQWDSWSNHPEGLDDDDAIIIAFMSLIQWTDTSMYDKLYLPDPRILPLDLYNSYVDEHGWHPAELKSEAIERIAKQLKNFIPQTEEPYWTLEYFTERIINNI